MAIGGNGPEVKLRSRQLTVVQMHGEPGSGKCQWEMTGRHLTLRADGDSVENTAFGGPIIYGHGEEESPGHLPEEDGAGVR